MADRSQAPRVLAMSVIIFTTVYILIILLAGPNPPALLFDAIQGYWNRRLAGFLLWGHVVVSYAINSQAFCSSMDRLFWHRLWSSIFITNRHNLINNNNNYNNSNDDDPQQRQRVVVVNHSRHAIIRWMILTVIMGVTAYTVANAIPFFDDLVALIGALTAVPLTLLLPALYWRKVLHVPLFCLWKGSFTNCLCGAWSWCWNTIGIGNSRSSSSGGCGGTSSIGGGSSHKSADWPSFALVVYSVIFMATATAGVLATILQDWETHGGRPFQCNK